MSNITAKKNFLEFLNLMQELPDNGLKVEILMYWELVD